METISIALMWTILSVVISYLTFRKNNKKEIESETAERIEMKIKLDYISKGIDDIKLNDKVRDDNLKKMDQRLIMVEGEVKAMFKRINSKGGEQ